MKLKKDKSDFLNIKEEELSISGPEHIGLLKAAFEKGASFRFQAKGFSMYPFIKYGDVLTLSPFNGRTIGLGNIVAFIHPLTEKLVIHRVVGKQNNIYLIKGDNIIKPDGLIPEKSILGYVVKVERDGKKVFFGLGPERFIIAFLNRRISIFVFLLSIWKNLRFLVGKFGYG